MNDIKEELFIELWKRVKPVYTPNFQVVLIEDDFNNFLNKIKTICDNYIKEKIDNNN